MEGWRETVEADVLAQDAVSGGDGLEGEHAQRGGIYCHQAEAASVGPDVEEHQPLPRILRQCTCCFNMDA